MARDPLDDGKESVLTELIEGVLSDMSGKQFAALTERVGHANTDPKQEAAEALSQLVKHGNINANELTPAQVLAKLQRRG